MAATNPNYHIDQNTKYATITLLPGLNEAQWSDIEQAGTDITGRLSAMRSPAVLVDLSPLNYMGSSMVAMIVRCWKNVQSNKGRIVVICTDDVVREVISLAGLTKVWPIVDSRDAALKELGVSSSAGVSTGGDADRWLVIAGIIAAVAGLVGVGMLLSQTGGAGLALGLLFGGAGLGFVLGLVTLVVSASSGRFWGLGVVLVSVGVAVIGFLNMNSDRPAGPAPAAQGAATGDSAEAASDENASSDQDADAATPTDAASEDDESDT